MKLEPGHVFSAVLIGGGVGYLIYKKTGSVGYGIGAAILLCLGEFFFLRWSDSLRKRK